MESRIQTFLGKSKILKKEKILPILLKIHICVIFEIRNRYFLKNRYCHQKIRWNVRGYM